MGKNKQLRKAENRKAQKESFLVAFSEYSKKLETLQTQIGKLSVKINALQRRQRSDSLALIHIEETGSVKDKYYVQMGRGFIQERCDTVLSSLKKDAESASADLPKLVNALNQFEKLKLEVVGQIKELNESIKNSSEQ
jgi:DNA repair exonuclease SbcCD ATPase subunit